MNDTFTNDRSYWMENDFYTCMWNESQGKFFDVFQEKWNRLPPEPIHSDRMGILYGCRLLCEIMRTNIHFMRSELCEVEFSRFLRLWDKQMREWSKFIHGWCFARILCSEENIEWIFGFYASSHLALKYIVIFINCCDTCGFFKLTFFPLFLFGFSCLFCGIHLSFFHLQNIINLKYLLHLWLFECEIVEN